jgi:hypothetical protein
VHARAVQLQVPRHRNGWRRSPFFAMRHGSFHRLKYYRHLAYILGSLRLMQVNESCTLGVGYMTSLPTTAVLSLFLPPPCINRLSSSAYGFDSLPAPKLEFPVFRCVVRQRPKSGPTDVFRCGRVPLKPRARSITLSVPNLRLQNSAPPTTTSW